MKDLLTSKKFIMTALGMVCATVAVIAGAITPMVYVGFITGQAGIFTVAQGIADHGKEKAKVEKIEYIAKQLRNGGE